MNLLEFALELVRGTILFNVRHGKLDQPLHVVSGYSREVRRKKEEKLQWIVYDDSSVNQYTFITILAPPLILLIDLGHV